jgi:hypothetical protein
MSAYRFIYQVDSGMDWIGLLRTLAYVVTITYILFAENK